MYSCTKLWCALAARLSSKEFAQKSTGDEQPGGASAQVNKAPLPTLDHYRSLTDDELEALLKTRDEQIKQLRQIYEMFHYEADRNFRRMIFDYHEKALQLSQVHGKMQMSSLQINREALTRMREQQEMLNRDKRLALLVSLIVTLGFWIWVRRHYVRTSELRAAAAGGGAVPHTSVAVTGFGSYGGNVFSSSKRSARGRETSWERESREKQVEEQKPHCVTGEEKVER